MPRPLSIYILTDGVWQPEGEPDQLIKDVASVLASNQVPQTHVGIQFIRFGEDEACRARLERLDRGGGGI